MTINAIHAYVKSNIRIIIGSFFLSSFLTAVLVIGETSAITIGLSLKDALIFFPAQFFSLFFIVYGLFFLTSKCQFTLSYAPVSIKHFIISATILSFIWVINWILFFPGYWTNDSISSLGQSLGEIELSNHHPVLFTALMGIFVNIGNCIGNTLYGMGAFTLFTAILFAISCAYISAWLQSRTRSNYIYLGSLCFFSLNILLAQYAITAWKDIYFSPLIVILCLKIYDIILSRGEILHSAKTFMALLIISVLVILFKSNGIFVVIPSLIILGIACKTIRIRIFSLALLAILISSLITGPIYSTLGVNNKAASESYSIPLQQIAKTISADGNIDNNSQIFLEKIFSFQEIKEVYDPYSVDPVKWADSFNNAFFENNQIEFIYVWFSLMPANLNSYLSAYRDITIGYWYPIVDNWLITNNGFRYSSEINSWSNAKWPNNLPFTESIDGETWVSYSNTSSALIQLLNNQRHFPLFNLIYSIGTMILILLALVTSKIIFKSAKEILPLTPLLLLWATLMIAAPVYCEFRYILAVHLALPILLTMFLYKIPSETKLHDQKFNKRL